MGSDSIDSLFETGSPPEPVPAEAEYTASQIGKRALDPRVMDAMKHVPRHEFVPAGVQAYAYENGPAPIGHGQTISQPYIVALMTDLLNPEPEHVGLEVGTGSGYQAASILKEHEAGAPVSDLSRCHGVAENTTYRWNSAENRVRPQSLRRYPRKHSHTEVR